MRMISVSSSAISQIGYESMTRRMGILFTKGSTVYYFCEVPQYVFDGLLNAESKGSYYDGHIRGRYQC